MCGALAIRLPSRVEQRAGEVEPLLDVDRVRGVRERHAHLLGDRHEEVVEHLEQHRIGVGADRLARRAAAGRARGRGDRRVADSPRQPGSTTVVAFASAMIAGPSTASPGASRLALADGRVAPAALEPDVYVLGRRAGGSVGVREDSRASPLSAAPIASTETASTTSGRSGMRKPKRCRCTSSNAAVISSIDANGTSSGVSVPSYGGAPCARTRVLVSDTPCAASSARALGRKRVETLAQLGHRRFAQQASDRLLAQRAHDRRGPCRRPTARRRAGG